MLIGGVELDKLFGAASWLNYAEIPGLSNEARTALERFTPATFGQATRLEGVTPADMSIVAVHVRRGEPAAGATA